MSAASDALRDPQGGVIDTKNERLVIFASSLGTVFEWYDFYLVGSLAAVMAVNFFSGVNETTSFILTLLMFAAGFAVRPFGALFFGRLGDLIGRKHTFLITMRDHGPVDVHRRHPARLRPDRGCRADHPGRPAAAAGPGARRRIRWRGDLRGRTRADGQARPLHLVDPDDGDARPVPVADRDPAARGTFTGCGVQRPGAGGSRSCISIVLLGVSVWIRLKLAESPVFKKMKEEGKASKAPLTDAFGNWENGKIVLMALLGAHRRPGRGLVHRPVLRAVLPDPVAEDRRDHGQLHDCRFPGAGYAVLHLLRLAVRQDRAQVDRPRRLPARGPDVFPGVQGADTGGQPGHLRSAAEEPGDGAGRPGRLLTSSSTRPVRASSPASATWPRRPWPRPEYRITSRRRPRVRSRSRSAARR